MRKSSARQAARGYRIRLPKRISDTVTKPENEKSRKRESGVISCNSLFLQHKTYFHSIVNKPIKASNGASFTVVISVDTMKNTIVNNYYGNIL